MSKIKANKSGHGQVKKLKNDRAGLKKLRANLALYSFHLFAVARHKRKHKSDFIAWSKYDPDKIFLVQLTPRCILVRPFCTSHLTPAVRSAIESTKRSIRVHIHKGDQIKPLKKDLRPEHWLTPDGKRELQSLLEKDLFYKQKPHSI